MRSPARLLLVLASFGAPAAGQDLAARGAIVHTASGAPIEDGVVIVRAGKITAVGPRASTPIPEGLRVLEARVVTPGLVDAHCALGLAGALNYGHDREELERSDPIQPELRALDAYNALDPLVGWVRELGVTTVHTGHAPRAVVSGQTMVVKTGGAGAAGEVLVPFAMVAATLGEGAVVEEEGKSPGNRAKAVALLRAELVRAETYRGKRAGAEPPDPDLGLDVLAAVLAGEVPMLVTAHELRDIQSALRLAEEFGFRLVLDGAPEVYDLLDEVRAAGVPVILHPTMMRAGGEARNASFETAAKLEEAGIPYAIQGGYESYVPRARVVLFEAAEAAAHGLAFDEALRAITLDAARILGVEARVGSLEVGKDGDLALWDGDPFEYTSHCVGVVIGGAIVSDQPR
jgi:imidazolonepropionase-like amidohydrolase